MSPPLRHSTQSEILFRSLPSGNVSRRSEHRRRCSSPELCRSWVGWPQPHKSGLEKTAASAFLPGRCELHSVLQGRGVDMVLVCGTVADVCCESTARDAATLGY
jgi:hypothetical protein